MPYATASDGVRLHYEEAGSGTPIIFVHEFGDNYRSWEQQIGYFSRRHRCIVTSRSKRRTWSACRWAASPRCISG